MGADPPPDLWLCGVPDGCQEALPNPTRSRMICPCEESMGAKMGKTNMPEKATWVFTKGELAAGAKSWVSNEGMRIEMFSMERSEEMNLDLELWRKMPGWFAIGQDDDDCLLCVDSKSGRCALVEIDGIDCDAAQEISKSLAALLSQGRWGD